MGLLRPLIFEDVGGDTPVALPGRWSNVTITNAMQGGFYSFAARYDAKPGNLLWMVDRLRKRIDVKDPTGRLVWQGLITEVEIHEPGYQYSYCLDDMANAVNVVYSNFTTDGAVTESTRPETGWATNATSISRYGRKERILSISGATATQAQLHRDRYLALHDYPLLSQRLTEDATPRPYAWVRGRGYWWTCTWQVYNQASTGSRATNTQIEDIVTAECPLIATTDVVATGNSVERERAANQMAWQEMLRLVALGDSSNNPLKIGVWDERELVVNTIPLTTIGYRRQGRDWFTDANGVLVEPWLLRAGRLLRLSQVAPGAGEVTPKLDDPRNVLMQQVSYSEDQGRATITPLGAGQLADMLMGQLQPWQ
jgi:hypothetical protein